MLKNAKGKYAIAFTRPIPIERDFIKEKFSFPFFRQMPFERDLAERDLVERDLIEEEELLVPISKFDINHIIEQIDNETLFMSEMDSTAMDYCQMLSTDSWLDDFVNCKDAIGLPAEDAMEHVMAVYLLIFVLMARKFFKGKGGRVKSKRICLLGIPCGKPVSPESSDT
ncbi:MAG: hypothetical protein ACHQJ6_03100 [Candidatus Berkiellales bacterium]